jgi:nicotinamide-nucleotide amidase
MKIANVIIGQKFQYADSFISYLYRVLLESLTKIDTTIFLKDNDPSIINEIHAAIENHDIIIIATSKQSWPLIAKTICTRQNDTLIPRENMLIPSKCTNFAKDSFRIDISNKAINVIKIDEYEVIPDILVQHQQVQATINILSNDIDGIRIMLNPLASTNDISVAYSKHAGGYVRCDAFEGKYGKLESFIQNVQNLLPQKVAIGVDLAKYLIDELSKYNMTISVAESCSGGLTSHLFTKHSGSSDIFVGSMVTYANEIKTSWLGVGETDLNKYGAVSEEIVSMMLDGIMNASNSHFSIAISGIAGPNGGTMEKPVGTVFIGVKHTSGIKKIEKFTFNGDRLSIQQASAHNALRLLTELFLHNF